MGVSSAMGGTVGAVPAGAVMPFAGASAPSGWLLCAGQTVSRSQYGELFATIGTAYGAGDGSTTFALPDLRGRVVAGVDNMGGSAASRLTNTVLSASNTIGATGGTQTHTLTSAQSGLPAHSHGMSVYNTGPFNNSFVGSGGQGGGFNYSISTGNNTAANASQAHPITQPTMVLNYIIKA